LIAYGEFSEGSLEVRMREILDVQCWRESEKEEDGERRGREREDRVTQWGRECTER
jgi:hypothetical protein